MSQIDKEHGTASQQHGGTQFHLLSFEGPDSYAQAGGLATRVSGLAEALAAEEFETHLWYVGDPALPGHESQGLLRLHRWCQWISRHHPGGVYDGECGKQPDFADSLPPFLLREHVFPAVKRGEAVVVLAEEWHTVDAVLHLDWLLRRSGLRSRVALLWNANNTFGFERIDWPRLNAAATITTVSRFMRQEMWRHGVDALVIPNGISADALQPVDRGLITALRARMHDRLVLSKVARWDPDKRWLLAVDTIADLKQRGMRPLLIARGGVEEHGTDVFARAAMHGLEVVERRAACADGAAILDSLAGLEHADIVSIDTPLSPRAIRTLFGASAAVLANSGREPFGLVGLEAMASGSVTCVGGTGEEYVVPGWNALVLQTENPREFLSQFAPLAADPGAAHLMRQRAVATARRFLWPEVVRRNLLPRVRFLCPTPDPGSADAGSLPAKTHTRPASGNAPHARHLPTCARTTRTRRTDCKVGTSATSS